MREFDVLVASTLVSVLGDGAAYLAATVLVYQRTGSSLLAAATFAVAFLPYLIGGTMLAALVDRLPPKVLLVGFDVLGGVLILASALPGAPLGVLFLALFALGVLAPVRSGTVAALVAALLGAESFVAGRSVQRICVQAGQVAGTALGGVLVAAFGPRGALSADAASFLLSATLVLAGVRNRPATGRPDAARSMVGDSLSGVRAVWSHRPVRRLLVLGWLVPFVAVVPEGLGAPAVAQAGGSAALVGLWLTAIPVGTVLGDLLGVWLVPSHHRRRLTWLLSLALPGLLIGFAAAPSLGVSIVLLVLSGGCSAYGLGLDQSLLAVTPSALRARMFTVNSTGLMLSQGLGFAVAGACAEVLSAHDTIAAAGTFGVAAVLLLRRSGDGRRDRTSGRR